MEWTSPTRGVRTEVEMKSKKHENSSTLEIARNERFETSIQQRGNSMKLPSHRSRIVIAGVTLAVTLGFTPALHAQYGGSGGQQQQPPPPSLQQPNPPAKSGAQQSQQPAPPAPAAPGEEEAYQRVADVEPAA